MIYKIRISSVSAGAREATVKGETKNDLDRMTGIDGGHYPFGPLYPILLYLSTSSWTPLVTGK